MLIQGTFSQQPSLRITSVLIPSEERVRPMDILYTPSSNLLSFFFTNGALLDGHVAGRSRDQWKDSFQCDQGAKL